MTLLHGWVEATSVVTLAASIFVMYAIIQPTEVRLAAAEKSINKLNLQPLPRRTAAQSRATELQNRIAYFYEGFPSRYSELDEIAKIFSAAEFWKVELQEGKYQLAEGETGSLVRLQITMPVKGDYIAIRKFVTQTLVDVPTLSLDSINFRREKIDEPVVESTLQFTLFMKTL